MQPFNIEVTDVDPGSTPHFEVMVAGSPGSSSACSTARHPRHRRLPCQSPGMLRERTSRTRSCSTSRTIRSAAANVKLEICGTAAQEIAHAWTLDHATPRSDPMTYKATRARCTFKNNITCGSDCGNCNGCGSCQRVRRDVLGQQPHLCMCERPDHAERGHDHHEPVRPRRRDAADGEAQEPDERLGAAARLHDRGRVHLETTASRKSISCSTACTTRADGAAVHVHSPIDARRRAHHHVEAMCATTQQATATASADFIGRHACTTDTDCMMPATSATTRRASPAPMATGGLGATCTVEPDCDVERVRQRRHEARSA